MVFPYLQEFGIDTSKLVSVLKIDKEDPVDEAGFVSTIETAIDVSTTEEVAEQIIESQDTGVDYASYLYNYTSSSRGSPSSSRRSPSSSRRSPSSSRGSPSSSRGSPSSSRGSPSFYDAAAEYNDAMKYSNDGVNKRNNKKKTPKNRSARDNTVKRSNGGGKIYNNCYTNKNTKCPRKTRKNTKCPRKTRKNTKRPRKTRKNTKPPKYIQKYVTMRRHR
jgi:hypothetical protein